MKEIKKTAKYIVLLGILYLTYELIVQDEDGYGFGIIALICWALVFLDLARIKLGDYEIDFMNTKHWNQDFVNDGKEEYKNYAFLTFPALRHLVQTFFLTTVPSASTVLTLCRFG